MGWNKKIIVPALIILFGAGLELLAAFLSDSYKNPAHLILAIGLLISLLFNLALSNTWMNVTDEKEKLNETIEGYKQKISTLSLQNNLTGNNFFHVGIRPIITSGTHLIINNPYEINIYVNAPFEISRRPDIKLITNKRWEVSCGTSTPPINAIVHNDKYEYSLKGCLNPMIVDNKFYLYKFITTFTETQENDFTFMIESRDYKSQINNTFMVRSA